MHEYTATYSPDDNKLRLYAATRLDAETYARVKAHGFKWAPQQKLFVAPMWTPEREDLLVELAGEIGDEDTSLAERAEERAERFEQYHENRAKDAERAQEAVHRIADNIPLGQPILVGHHSERHARRDAERIENGMRKAVNMWKTAQYWKSRAAGAVRHAKYKELPAVRARRIKGLEAEKRKVERNTAQSSRFLKTYQDPEAQGVTLRDGRNLIKALLETFEGGLMFEDRCALEKGLLTVEEAKQKACANLSRSLADDARWIEHYDNRLAYEKGMLDEQGASALLGKKPRPKQLPLCNYRQEVIHIENMYRRGEMMHYPQLEMTAAEYAKIPNDYKGTRVVEHSHRVRTCMRNHGLYSVFLTDSKVHEKPQPIEPEPVQPRARQPIVYQAPERTVYDDMQETLRQGVQVVSAPQLFPTPQDVAERMVELADIQPGQRVLEPSAGTGNLLKAMPNVRPEGEVVAVELNQQLAALLDEQADQTICGDFLAQNGNLGTFDRVVMNPPFKDGVDIQHIRHAWTMVKPGGKLVALCANGPRQQAQLEPLADYWEALPPGTFKEAGTGVNVALLVMEKRAVQP